MWIFTKDGFFSAVEHREDDRYLMIRARFKEDLEKLISKVSHNSIVAIADVIEETPDADYPYRTVLPKMVWSKYVADEANAIDYDNFKGEVLNDEYGTERWDRYHGVWSVMKYGNI